MTLGVELPLDNDFARADGTFGIPDLNHHRARVELADRLGFHAIWMRDVPLWLPRTFGDAGQVFDPIAYLGYLAAATTNALLATAAVVLPLRHPLMLAKQAASIDVLSGGRLILGVATGDRPEEYPAFGADFDARGRTYRDTVTRMRALWTGADESARVLPPPLPGQCRWSQSGADSRPRSGLPNTWTAT
jgi:luciferase-type oxidoreductase